MDCLEMKEDFCIQKVQVKLPCAPHTHDFLEIAYIYKGWVMHTVGKERYRLNTGDYVLIDYGEVHGYETGSSDLEIVNCLFQPAMIDLSLRGTKHFSCLLTGCLLGMGHCATPSHTAVRMLHDSSGAVRQILDTMLMEAEQTQLGYHVMLRLFVTMLVVEIARKAELSAQYQPGVEVSWMMEEIRKNLDRPQHLETYAAQFHMRPEALGKQFYQQTGERFLHYIRRRRMEMACRLLLETTLSVTAVAEKCGYEDNKSFRAAFREIIGVTPTDYRKKYRAVH